MSEGDGPGRTAGENHDRLSGRLVEICKQRGVDYSERAIIGTTPYRNPFVADLLLLSLPTYPSGLAVIARWQAVSGSADQKLPFLLLCVERSKMPAVIVLDGEGWSQGVWDYLGWRKMGYFVGALTVEGFTDLLTR